MKKIGVSLAFLLSLNVLVAYIGDSGQQITGSRNSLAAVSADFVSWMKAQQAAKVKMNIAVVRQWLQQLVASDDFVGLWLHEHLLRDTDFTNWVKNWLQRSHPGAIVDDGYVLRWLSDLNNMSTPLSKYENEKYSDPQDIFDVINKGRIDRLSDFSDQVNATQVDRTHPTGVTPLMLAAELGNAVLVGRLIGLGANLNSVNSNGDTALMVAVRNGYPDIVRMLFLTPVPPKATWAYRATAAQKKEEAKKIALQLLNEASARVNDTKGGGAGRLKIAEEVYAVFDDRRV